jgi:hypothetical protein
MKVKNLLDLRRFFVPSAGVEPAHPKILVFETNASTNSASWASCFVVRQCKYSVSTYIAKGKISVGVKLLDNEFEKLLSNL